MPSSRSQLIATRDGDETSKQCFAKIDEPLTTNFPSPEPMNHKLVRQVFRIFFFLQLHHPLPTCPLTSLPRPRVCHTVQFFWGRQSAVQLAISLFLGVFLKKPVFVCLLCLLPNIYNVKSTWCTWSSSSLICFNNLVR